MVHIKNKQHQFSFPYFLRHSSQSMGHSHKKTRPDNSHKDTPTNEQHFEEISLDSRKRKNTPPSEGKGKRGWSSSRLIFFMERPKLVCVLILFAINLLNYMDRFTIAGILTDVQNFYGISDSQAGFLQTIFIIFFMTIAPICGFLGDRFNRKRIMLIGLGIWVGAVFASSFVTKNHFWAFLFLRGVVGIGEASYAVIAPTIIADLFIGKLRSKVLMFFYFAIPVGSGLGYVIGSSATSLAKTVEGSVHCPFCWQWGLRVTPLFGIVCLITLLFFVEEPVRGQVERTATTAQPMPITHESPALDGSASVDEGQRGERGSEQEEETHWWGCIRSHMRSYVADIGHLLACHTFIWSTVAYTAVVFVTGTLSWWGPSAVEHAEAMAKNLNDTSELSPGEKSRISIIFGAITCVAGIGGVSMGSLVAQHWKTKKCCFSRWSERADPLVSSFGSFVATPLMMTAFILVTKNQLLSWIAIFLTIMCLCLNWAVNVDMLMSIIGPERRSIASAVQILISHLFGDASGPYLVGAISDFTRGSSKLPKDRFDSLITAFYLPNGLLLFSAATFFVAAWSLPTDLRRMEADRAAREERERGLGQTRSSAVNESPFPTNIGPQGRQNEAFE